MPDEPSPADPQNPSGFLTDDELDAIEDDLARAERTLSLLADNDVDPAAASAWIAAPSAPDPQDATGAATRS
ncbi:hypothetical protein [Candidatus Poriferisodalis sp.]|uniref:hypothetical protein n=1 Tax=Candidatus Poriferisodalis sp. TaxID=3101277 RepID=UPI003B0156C7